jgi:hypothetical protein
MVEGLRNGIVLGKDAPADGDPVRAEAPQRLVALGGYDRPGKLIDGSLQKRESVPAVESAPPHRLADIVHPNLQL